MNSKIPLLTMAIITALAVALIAGTQSTRDLSDTFTVNATYMPEQGTIRISFEDSTGQSTGIVMEVLGMKQSYQRQYNTTSFVQEVAFGPPPEFGWKVHPVTFIVEHPQLGKIGIKTEVYESGGQKPPVIYSSL